ncbi:MAG: undecaprenyl-diphosphate phosphatase [Gemmatimonadales bacterium]|nr:undecaprenyl-diphosphate phosphatase [Gemmatimonadales bacterium]
MTEQLNMILLAIIQGLTEFLPVSSSGHLVLGQHLLGFRQGDVFFDVVLHCGTLGSVLIIYRRELLRLLRFDGPSVKYILCLGVGTLPAVLVGLLAKDFIMSLFHSPLAAGFGLLVTAGALFSTRWRYRTAGGVQEVWEPRPFHPAKALVIGMAQALAIMPGLSRSGMTITASIWIGLARAEAARFSFLLSIPAIAGALVLQLVEGVPVNPNQVLVLIGAAVVSCLVGLLALRWTTLAVIQAHFWKFGIYCLVLGLVTIFILG